MDLNGEVPRGPLDAFFMSRPRYTPRRKLPSSPQSSLLPLSSLSLSLSLSSRRLPRARARDIVVASRARARACSRRISSSRALVTSSSSSSSSRPLRIAVYSLKVPGDMERVFKRCNFFSFVSFLRRSPLCDASLHLSPRIMPASTFIRGREELLLGAPGFKLFLYGRSARSFRIVRGFPSRYPPVEEFIILPITCFACESREDCRRSGETDGREPVVRTESRIALSSFGRVTGIADFSAHVCTRKTLSRSSSSSCRSSPPPPSPPPRPPNAYLQFNGTRRSRKLLFLFF